MAYIIIGCLLIYLVYKGKYNKSYRFIVFAFMSLCLGFRNNVGTDFFSYKDYFNSQSDFLDVGFNYICFIVRSFGGNANDMFFVIGTISLFFVYRSLNKYPVKYVPSAIMCYIFSFPFLANGIRQGLAISIFFYAYRFIEERKLSLYFITILIASLFHSSILLVLPLYFIAYKSYKVSLYILLYVLSFLVIFVNIDMILQPLNFLFVYNERFFSYIDSGSNTLQGYFSFGIFSKFVLYFFFFVISLKNDMHIKYPVLFNLLFCAVIFYNLRIASSIFVRVEIIFSWFQYLMLPLIIYDRKMLKYKNIMISLSILIYVVLFVQVYFIDKNNCLYPYDNVLITYI